MKLSRFPACLALAVLVSCSPEEPDSPSQGTVMPVLTARDAGFAKTAFGKDDYSVCWSDGDALSVFNAPAGTGNWSGNLKFSLDDAPAGRFIPAPGQSVPFNNGTDYDWRAVYPYTAGLSPDASPQIPFAQTQNGKSNAAHLAQYDILYGEASSTRSPDILMHHTGTLLKWTVMNDSELPFSVTGIRFSCGTDTYVLTVNGDAEIAPSYSADFYMVAQPFDFAAGDAIKVSVQTSAGTETQIKRFPSARSFEAGKYNTAKIVCNPTASATWFHVAKDNGGKWRLYKNDEEFFIRGAAANNYYDKVAGVGGNVIRTYSTSQIDAALNAAEATGVYVLVGLPVGRERDGFDFGNTSAIASQTEKIQNLVRTYGAHPNVLGWILGNELDSNYSDSRVWTVVENLAAAVKAIDPYHPVTTALAGAKQSAISEIKAQAPSLDFLCFNSYYPSSSNLASNLSSYGWNKPWVLSEFGPRGTWGLTTKTDPPLTSWGACVEQTSTQKAAIYKAVLSGVVQANKDNGCIGSCAFVWGYQSSGDVLTWYGLFDTDGNSFAAVDELQYAWTGSYPTILAPEIHNRHSMTIDDGMIGDNNIALETGSSHSASVVASSPSGATLSYQWFIYKEGEKNANGISAGQAGLIDDSTKPAISFRAPSAAGYYRLLVFVRDLAGGKVASASIPFSVIPEKMGSNPDGWNPGHQNW